MTPKKLILKGFYGISSGLGKDAIEVDLSGLEDKQLIAICGPNGAGKSTIMDNLHPYRVMPSRCSKPTPSSFSYYDNMAPHVLNASKELIWSYKGITYRSLVEITKAGKTRKQEAFLYVLDPTSQAFVPFVRSDGVASDGKTETYDTAVEEILGKPEVFFAYIFSAQGKPALNTLTNADVKNLLASMLGVEHVKLLGAKASEVSKALKPYLDDIKSANSPNLAQVARKPSVLESIGKIEQELVVNQQESETAKLANRKAIEDLGIAKSLFSQQATVTARRYGLESELQSATQARDNAVASARDQFSKLNTANAARLQELNSSGISLAESLKQSSARALEAELLIKGKDACTAASLELSRLKDALASKNCLVEDLSNDVQPLSDLRKNLGELQLSLNSQQHEGKSLSAVVDSAKVVASLADEVPCGGTEFHGKCPLLREANTAKLQIEDGQIKLVTLRTDYKTSSATAKNLQSQIDLLLASEQKLTLAKKEVETLQTRKSELLLISGKFDQIEAAEKSLQSLNDQVARYTSELDAIQNQVRTLKAEMLAVSADEEGKVKAALGAAQNDVVRIQEILATLPVLDASSLTNAEKLADSTEDAIAHLAGNREGLNNQLFSLKTEMTLIGVAELKVAASANEATALSTEMSYWSLLSTAFSNDGIVALSIDDANPSISRLANQLLEDCYGGRFQLRLATQKATATGVLKEDFEIYVNDALRGEEKMLGMMSGGERVWVNECLVRAFALYKTQVSGSDYTTLFTDESDGPLDPERKRQFMAMKRAVLKAGGYEREFFITQTPELWLMADYVIDVTKL